jgi:hypothetical protein
VAFWLSRLKPSISRANPWQSIASNELGELTVWASEREVQMSDRHLASTGVLAIMSAIVFVAPASLAGQARGTGANAAKEAASKTWTPPRTPDGQPDLQGVWVNNSATPLERPKALEGRSLLTDEEVSELKKRVARLFDVNGNSDFAGGDDVFLAALANPERFKNPNATGSALAMVERDFDHRTSLIVDPPDGRVPPLTPEAQQKRATAAVAGQRPPAGPEDLSNFVRCITFGMPRLGGNAASYNSYYQILQTAGYVVLVGEVIHDARIIPLDGHPHRPPSIRQWEGDSRGRWEGNTLVVDTTNFSPNSNFMGSAENLHVVERLTRVAPGTIDYEITLNDPTTWTKPWTAMIHLKETQDKMFEYACHEGNYHTMTGILAGARAEEKASEEAAAKGAK